MKSIMTRVDTTSISKNITRIPREKDCTSRHLAKRYLLWSALSLRGISLFERNLMNKLVPYIMVALVLIPVPCQASRDVNELTTETREKFYELAELAGRAGKDLRLLCTYRSQESQDKLFAKGRTSPGKKVTWTRRSKHTRRIAFDIAVVKDGRISWKPEDYLYLGRLAEKVGLTWGGNWKVRDYGHFELKSN